MSLLCGPHPLAQLPGAVATGLRPQVWEGLRGPRRAAGWGSGHSPLLCPQCQRSRSRGPVSGPHVPTRSCPSWVRAPGPCLLLPDLRGQPSDPTPVHTPGVSVGPGEMLRATLGGQPGGPSSSRCLGDRTGACGAAPGERQNVLEQASLQALSLEPEESVPAALPPGRRLEPATEPLLAGRQRPGQGSGSGRVATRPPIRRAARSPAGTRSRPSEAGGLPQKPHRRARSVPLCAGRDGPLPPTTAPRRAPRLPHPAVAPVMALFGSSEPCVGSCWVGSGQVPSPFTHVLTAWPPTTAVPWLCHALLHLRSGLDTGRARPRRATTRPLHCLAAFSPGSRMGHPPGHLRLQMATRSLRGQRGKRTRPQLMAGPTPRASRRRAAAAWTKVTRLGSDSGTWRADCRTHQC